MSERAKGISSHVHPVNKPSSQEEVIKLLRLAKCADTNVGGGMARGVSVSSSLWVKCGVEQQ